MKGVNTWSFAPYKPFLFDTGDIYICRLYPGEGKIGLDWLPLDGADVYTVVWKKRGAYCWEGSASVQGTSYVIEGLEDLVDYELQVLRQDKKSRVRLAKTGAVPGDVVVNYLHPEDDAYSFSGRYLCSPSLVRLPDGGLLASMDLFAGGAPQDLSLIYRSDDNGKTWKYVSELFPCFWGKMFVHKDALYMLSVSTEYGDLLIGRSDDGGKTFGMPTVLLRGSSGFKQKGVHKNPEPVVSYNGRLWNTLEWGSWGTGTHAAMCMSIDENDDLLVAENWHFTPPVPYDPNWPGTAEGKSAGCIEGTLVLTPPGWNGHEEPQLMNIMRYQMGGCTPSFGMAVVMGIDGIDEPLRFERTIPFPGNHSKFMIKVNPKDGKYYSLVSYLTEEHPDGRNWLVLIRSDDLIHWEKVMDVFDYRHLPVKDVGFQYVDFFFEGDEILYLSRTAWNGAHNFHDANYSVFGRLKV
ncbi:MAG: exo-alpha-sialidase [Clostridia bacterium]|nr:exo-alpha-sialidase [Clostridia bacterium]